MADITPFNFGVFPVRVISHGKKQWFAAADVCAALGIKNHRDSLMHLDEDEKGVVSSDTLGGIQNISVVNESGLYALVLRSRKPEARKFAKWVTSEVLPEIRKTGVYVGKPFTVNPGDVLTAEEQNTLRLMLKSAVEKLPKAKQAGAMVQGWSKLKSHFGCSYRNIAAHEWVEAASLLARHAAEWGIQRASTPQQPQQPQQSAPVALLENPMTPIYDARRRTLRQAMVLLCNGRQTNMAHRLGTGASYVSRILSTGRSAKGIGGDYAREIEQKLGLPALWLDDARNASATSIVSAQPCASDAVPESARRSKELRILLGGIERMAPVKDRELTEAIQLARSIQLHWEQ